MAPTKSKPKPPAKPKPPTRAKPSTTTPASTSSLQIPPSLHQTILNGFVAAFPDLLTADKPSRTLAPLVQQVKHHLYERDFAAAFGAPALLEAYAARWSPSRALCYLGIFAEALQHHSPQNSPPPPIQTEPLPPLPTPATTEILCLGGGAGAESAAVQTLADLRPHLAPPRATLVDIASWDPVLTSLHSALDSARLACSASAAAATNTPPPRFRQHDLLSPAALTPILDAVGRAHMVTLMFTLNELYATSRAGAHALLLGVSAAAGRGTLLLVVDSPGSYSTVKLGAGERRYPMRWLLDHALLVAAPGAVGGGGAQVGVGVEQGGGSGGVLGEGVQDMVEDGVRSVERKKQAPAVWEKVLEEESKWFRMPEGLKYPIELENMRYQLHLYRRL